MNQIVGQPGTGFVQPLQLELLRPSIIIVQAGLQLFDIAWQAIGHRLMDINDVAAPFLILFVGNQLVEFVALAVRRGNHAQLPAGRDDREQRLPDFAAVLMEGELVEKHIGREAAGGVWVGGQRGNLAAAG